MDKKTHSFEYLRDRAEERLPEADAELAARAAEACRTATYAPYSHFRVGAAARLEDGEILSAGNQESEVFPSGMCAERSLLYYVQSNRPGKRIRALAIASDPSVRECTPCGACRQALLEYETLAHHNVEVILVGSRAIYVMPSVRSTLPLAFSEF